MRVYGVCTSAMLVLACAGFAAESALASTILGTTETFAVLGGSTVTNTGASTVNGDLGVYAGTSITGLGSVTLTGTVQDTTAAAMQAQADAMNAYTILTALPSSVPNNLTGQDLGGLTLGAGVYVYNSSAQLTGTLTLNFAGASNEDIVVQIGSTLTTAAASVVQVENANATDGVFFQVGSSATLGANTLFEGNILALASISLGSGAEIVCGRAIALNGAVTMIGNTISDNCAGAGSEGTGTSDYGSVGLSGGDLVSLGYTGGGFDGVPPGQDSSTPEPSTFALLGSALACIPGFVARRRRKSSQKAANDLTVSAE